MRGEENNRALGNYITLGDVLDLFGFLVTNPYEPLRWIEQTMETVT